MLVVEFNLMFAYDLDHHNRDVDWLLAEQFARHAVFFASLVFFSSRSSAFSMMASFTPSHKLASVSFLKTLGFLRGTCSGIFLLVVALGGFPEPGDVLRVKSDETLVLEDGAVGEAEFIDLEVFFLLVVLAHNVVFFLIIVLHGRIERFRP